MKRIKAIPKILLATATSLSPVPDLYKIEKEVLEKPIDFSKKVDLFDFQVENEYGKTDVKMVDQLDDHKDARKGFGIVWKGPQGLDAEILVEKRYLSKASSKIIIKDEDYVVQFVRDSSNLKPCDIDFEKRVIILNECSPIISTGETRDIFYVILLTFHYLRSEETHEMYKNVLNSLLANITQ